jgi:cytochrome c-type biogenesis protein CcmH/NrfG
MDKIINEKESGNPATSKEWVEEARKYEEKFEHYGKRRECYENALKLDPDNWEALAYLGNMLSGAVDNSGVPIEESVRYLTRATELNPDNSEIWVWLACSLFNRNRKQEANQAIEKALVINPGNAEAHFNKMLFMAANGPSDDQEKELLLCLRSDPNHPMARMLYRMKHGKEYNGGL